MSLLKTSHHKVLGAQGVDDKMRQLYTEEKNNLS